MTANESPAILGLRSSFNNSPQLLPSRTRKNTSVFGTHCILFRETLASRTLPPKSKDVLSVTVEGVTFIQAGALNSRLFKILCKDIHSEHEALFFAQMFDGFPKGTCLYRFINYKKYIVSRFSKDGGLI